MARVENLDLTWLGKNKWRLNESFTLGRSTVPAGFVFDGVSAPWIIQWYAEDEGEGLPAAIIHDYHYSTHGVERWQADEEFWANLILTGVRPAKAWILWAGVRIFGWWAWRH